MTRTLRSLTRLLVAAAVLPAAVHAQRPAAPGGPPPRRADAPGPSVSRLIDARRELELTSRQLVQLDSLERIQVAERRQRQERLAQRRDSLTRDRAALRGLGRDSLRALARQRMEAMQPLLAEARRRDSATMAAAERILTEPQRQRLREMRAEARGYQRAMQDRRGTAGERMVRERAVRERAMRDRPMPARRMAPERPLPPRPGRE